MNNGGYKLIIVEGEDREKDLFESLENFFFKKDKLKYINLPAKQNIYMLWNILKQDEFQTDMVEILRENVDGAGELLNGISRDDIDEIFLFFDFDVHQDNIPKRVLEEMSAGDIIKQLLAVFNNETEFGKLYISYPMIEAIRDLSLKGCHTYSSRCTIKNNELTNYKNKSGENNPLGDVRKYNREVWQNIFEAFAMRISCLFSLTKVISFEKYRNIVEPLNIYIIQEKRFLPDETFILSAIPEFILDYFKKNFWRSLVKVSKLHKDASCLK